MGTMYKLFVFTNEAGWVIYQQSGSRSYCILSLSCLTPSTSCPFEITLKMPAPSTESKKQTPLNGDSGPKSPAQICCSKEYYMPDGDVWALVKSDTYCRFHSYWTRNATNFYESFLEPGKKLEKDALPGTGPEKAIIIRNATIQEFERFLWVFYNKKYDDYSEASLEDWFTILRLSHEWGYEDVKAMALRYIKGRAEEIPDLVDRIVLYEKYSLPSDTILPMYMTLCTREEFPTDTECSKLGDTRALQIHRARERL
ncbi:hypothetical protein DFP72DRAFT_1137717, partial [Ephemerocybe angulata]